MKFTLYWADKPEGRPKNEEVEIKTLEDLENLDKEFGEHSLVVQFGDNACITVYNDYLE